MCTPRPPLAGRLSLAHWIAVDALLTLAVGLLVGVSAPGDQLSFGLPRAVGYAAIGATALLLVLRRLRPTWVFAAVLGLAAFCMVAGVTRIAFLPVAVAIYPVATGTSRRTSVLALLAALAAIVVTIAVAAPHLGPPDSGPGLAVTTLLVTGAVWTIGSAVREQRRYVAELRHEATRRAVTEERLRIARELHDVVAHGMSVIAVQAGVANYVVQRRPEEAHRALRSIEETSRAGLHELRQLLCVLRGDGDAPVLGPAPGLADLDALITRTRRAGVPVDLDVRGPARPLPPGVDLSAYRIVQEALTNVVKHAGPARGRVLLEYQPEALRIEVTDDGRGGTAAAPGGRTGGHGIIGMRERVALYGGRLHAGPRGGGGFAVRALLPVAEQGAA